MIYMFDNLTNFVFKEIEIKLNRLYIYICHRFYYCNKTIVWKYLLVFTSFFVECLSLYFLVYGMSFSFYVLVRINIKICL